MPLQEHLKEGGDRKLWTAAARNAAILGSSARSAACLSMCASLPGCGCGVVPRSIESTKSGLRSWIAFATEILGVDRGRVLPPKLDGLLAWSRQFRRVGVCMTGRVGLRRVRCISCAATFSNYLGHVRTGCLLVGVSDAVFDETAVKRAKSSIVKRAIWEPRPKRFVQMSILQRLVPLVIGDESLKTTLLWILTSYIFLLRRVR